MQTLVNSRKLSYDHTRPWRHPQSCKSNKIQQILIQTISAPPKAANARELMQTLVNARKRSYDPTHAWRHAPSRKSHKIQQILIQTTHIPNP